MSARIREMAMEAFMVVFAVVVALAIEEWREEQGLQEFAGQARTSVLAEVQANLDEMRSTGPTLSSAIEVLGQVISEEDLTLLNGDISFELPEISSAAWSAAQASQAGPYLEYDWVIQVARAYEGYETYSRIADQAIDALGDMVGSGPSVAGLSVLYGRLTLLNGIHSQVEEGFGDILEGEAAP